LGKLPAIATDKVFSWTNKRIITKSQEEEDSLEDVGFMEIQEDITLGTLGIRLGPFIIMKNGIDFKSG